MRGTTILVIAKEPVPGRAKTRLSPPCTPDEAASLAEAALRQTLTTVARVGADRHLLVLDGRPGRWLPAGFEVVPQCEGDLAARLAAAFDAVDGPALLVGMDTPQLSATVLRHALATLRHHDAVLGLASDGGWWSLGLRSPVHGLFDGVPMSTAVTGATQHRRLRALGLRTRLLPVLRDVDCFADALEVAALDSKSEFAAAVDRVTRAVRKRSAALASVR